MPRLELTQDKESFIRKIIFDAVKVINPDSPEIKKTNKIGVQNRIIDIATGLYMQPTNTLSLISGFSAPSLYFKPDTAQGEDRAWHYGVGVGEPTGLFVYDYKNTGMSHAQIVKHLLAMRAGAKSLIRTYVRAQGASIFPSVQEGSRFH